MDIGTATMYMGMVLMATMDMERIPMDIMAMAIMVMLMVTMDMGRMGMVTMTKRISKIRDAPAVEAVETLSRCPSVLILFLFRSLLKMQKQQYTVSIVFGDGGELFTKLTIFYVVILL